MKKTLLVAMSLIGCSLLAISDQFELTNVSSKEIGDAFWAGGLETKAGDVFSGTIMGNTGPGSVPLLDVSKENILAIYKDPNKVANKVTFNPTTKTFTPTPDHAYTFEKGKTLYLFWDGSTIIPQSDTSTDKKMQLFMKAHGRVQGVGTNNVTSVIELPVK
jgi:hypothetical protein